MTLLHYCFDLTSSYRLGQKYKNIYVRFLVQMKTLKSPFEINWPLVRGAVMGVGILTLFVVFVSFKKCPSQTIRNTRLLPKSIRPITIQYKQFKCWTEFLLDTRILLNTFKRPAVFQTVSSKPLVSINSTKNVTDILQWFSLSTTVLAPS